MTESANATTEGHARPAPGAGDNSSMQFAGFGTQARIEAIAAEVLKRANANSRDERMTASQIFDAAIGLGLSVGVERGTFQTYLSIVSGTASSAVTSAGRGRGGGYYLSPAAEKLKAEVQEAPTAPAPEAEAIGEASLYPVLQQWLRGQGYQSRVTAPMRTLGRWANPDVTGIRVSEHVGRVDVELLTIEAKLSLAQWEYGFFEAVAHRRFANRAYLAFPLPEEAAEKLPDGLRYACELYRVGALVMVLDDEEYEQVKAGRATSPLTLEDVTIQEVYTAQHAPIRLEYQRRFCEAIGITQLNELFTWGSGAGAA